jgi:hypothetical protein
MHRSVEVAILAEGLRRVADQDRQESHDMDLDLDEASALIGQGSPSGDGHSDLVNMHHRPPASQAHALHGWNPLASHPRLWEWIVRANRMDTLLATDDKQERLQKADAHCQNGDDVPAQRVCYGLQSYFVECPQPVPPNS